MKRWLKLDMETVDKAVEADEDQMTVKATVHSENGTKKEVDLILSITDDGLEVGWEE